MCLKSFILVLCSVAVTLDLHHHLGKCVSVCRFASPATFTAADFVLLSLVFNLTSNLHSNLANEFKVSSYSFWKDFSPRDTDCSDSRAFLSDPFFCIFPCFSFSFIFVIDLKFHEDKFQGEPIFCGLLGLFQMI